MSKTKFDFSFIEQEIRNKTFGILNTINPKGSPHTTGILYGVSKPDTEFSLYLLSSKNYQKVKNIERNPDISFVIPFPHHIFRFVPASTITLNGTAEVIPLSNEEIMQIFAEKRILRLIIADIDLENEDELIFIKIKPNPKILCYGVGIGMFKLRGSHTTGGYSVTIPEERRAK